jgi:hypothetical protein
MSVTESEANHAYELLVSAANSAGLAWIVREVEEEAALGRVELKSLRVTEPDLFPVEEVSLRHGDKTRSSRTAFNVSRPLTPQERLISLVDGLEVGVVELNRVAGEVLGFFEEELAQERVTLAPEGNTLPVTDISRSELQARIEATSRLAMLLNELKAEI